MFEASIPARSLSDVTKEYANTSHTITLTTPGMEMMMEEYFAYKAGTRRDPVAYLNGGKANIKKNNLLTFQAGRQRTTCMW